MGHGAGEGCPEDLQPEWAKGMAPMRLAAGRGGLMAATPEKPAPKICSENAGGDGRGFRRNRLRRRVTMRREKKKDGEPAQAVMVPKARIVAGLGTEILECWAWEPSSGRGGPAIHTGRGAPCSISL
jgi:hypothetical protein